MENKKLTGGFLLIESYAQWENDKEWETNRYDDERPTAILAVKEWFLQKFAEDPVMALSMSSLGTTPGKPLIPSRPRLKRRRRLPLPTGRRWFRISSFLT